MNMHTRITQQGVLAGAVRQACQWRLLTLWAFFLLLPCLVLVLPVWFTLGAGLDYSVHAASLAKELDLLALADLLHGQAHRSGALLMCAGLALGLTFMLSPLLSGMVVTAARAHSAPGFGMLLGGARLEYGRMLRMLLWAIVPLGAAGALGNFAVDAAARYGERAILESNAQLANIGAYLVLGLLLTLAHASIDAGRAALALDARRTSAINAWWLGCKMLVKRPGATLVVYFGLSAAGLALAAALAYARIHLPPISTLGLVLGFAITECGVLALAWMRSARLMAMMALARAAN